MNFECTCGHYKSEHYSRGEPCDICPCEKFTEMELKRGNNMNVNKTVEHEHETLRGSDAVAHAVDRLGLNNATTNMGAIEVLAKEMKEGTERLANSLDAIGSVAACMESIGSALHRIADQLINQKLEKQDKGEPNGR